MAGESVRREHERGYTPTAATPARAANEPPSKITKFAEWLMLGVVLVSAVAISYTAVIGWYTFAVGSTVWIAALVAVWWRWLRR